MVERNTVNILICVQFTLKAKLTLILKYIKYFPLHKSIIIIYYLFRCKGTNNIMDWNYISIFILILYNFLILPFFLIIGFG